MQNPEQLVQFVVRRIIEQKGETAPTIENHQRLTADLGLESLDVAKVVAVLEVELEVDPFAQLVAITDVRTVGDLCDAYRRALAGETPAEAEPALDASRQRAAARRGAPATQDAQSEG
ncbi:MAG: acyl carrier protein [Pirellulales bacterium]